MRLALTIIFQERSQNKALSKWLLMVLADSAAILEFKGKLLIMRVEIGINLKKLNMALAAILDRKSAA